MMRIRKASAADAAAIARVKIQGWRATYRGIVNDELLDNLSQEENAREWAHALGQPQNVAWVAEDEAQSVVAFAVCGPERNSRPDYAGELYALYVLESCQGRGVGRQLVGRSARSLLDAQMTSMLVWVLAENPNRRFYETLGGVFVAEQPLQIGRQSLVEVAYGWRDLAILAR